MVFVPKTNLLVHIYYKWRAENMSTTSKASQRIEALLDVSFGGQAHLRGQDEA